MERQLALPVSVEDFKEIRQDGYYYVDKTSLIEQVLIGKCKVTLFTRPRRFGKTLNMSMLKHFFEIGTDSSLFEGLHISQNTELCDQYMGKYPVISISFKGIEAESYAKARSQLVKRINREVRRFQILLTSDILSDVDKDLFRELLKKDMDDATLVNSLQELTELLEIHFSQRVIVLIDEYDVPLAKAYEHGYYDEMVLLMRNLFGNVLKTNESLAFAVLTGCLRIAKESIFTGLNNFKVYSITDIAFDEAFGFTNDEVREMLRYYNLENHFDGVKEWYDGYHFGNADVYCPWDVVNYCYDHYNDPDVAFQNYWMNTSGNDVIDHFVDSIDDPGMLTKTELENLVNGDTVVKYVIKLASLKTGQHQFHASQRGKTCTDFFIKIGLIFPKRSRTESTVFIRSNSVRKDSCRLQAVCDTGADNRYRHKRTVSDCGITVRNKHAERLSYGNIDKLSASDNIRSDRGILLPEFFDRLVNFSLIEWLETSDQNIGMFFFGRNPTDTELIIMKHQHLKLVDIIDLGRFIEKCTINIESFISCGFVLDSE